MQKIPYLILILSLSACTEKKQPDETKIKVKEVTLYDVRDDIGPPENGQVSHFKTLQDWLISICNDKKPEKPIATYEAGIFESPGEYIIFLVGLNKYDKGDTSFTRIEFEPSKMYFQLPEDEYKDLKRDEVLNKLIIQLKDFTRTEKFKTSFLTNADSLILTTNGQTIWSKQ